MPAGSVDTEAKTRALVERIRELDHAHRNRLGPTRLSAALSLRLVRRYLGRLFAPIDRPQAQPVTRPQAADMLVAFAGHATCQIVTAKTRLLVDPMLADGLAGFRRPVAAAIDARDLDDVDLVLITHGRPDRLHPASLHRVSRKATLVVPRGLGARPRSTLKHMGFTAVREIEPGQSFQFSDLTITAVSARHDGTAIVPGSWRPGLGYVVQGSQVAAYVSGPTGYFSGFAEIGRRLRPDVAVLPIAGYQPDALRAGNLSPLDAIYAFEDLRARLLVPVGYDAFPVGYEPADEPLAWLRKTAIERGVQDALAVLPPGGVLRVQREPGAG